MTTTPAASVTPTPLKLDPELMKRLKRLAAARHRAPHLLMREAIAQYVEREERRQALHKDAVAAWEEYEETGLHVSGDEVTAWLETWGTESESPTPACHK
jgi:predicted transcriptional regulator